MRYGGNVLMVQESVFAPFKGYVQLQPSELVDCTQQRTVGVSPPSRWLSLNKGVRASKLKVSN